MENICKIIGVIKVMNMDRYYNILGIPSNSSKEVIKNAYHTKMKALHPDKVHGTPLEETATFFAAEINEAYSNLMAQFNNNPSTPSTPNYNKPTFIEEDIYVETIGNLKYTLSDDLNAIIIEIYNRFRCTLPDGLLEIPWNINPALSPNVQKAMQKYNFSYSMTSYKEGPIAVIVINKMAENNWYIAGFEISSQPKKTSVNTETYSNKNTSYTKPKNIFGTFIKILITIIIFSVIFQICNSLQSLRSQSQTTSPKIERVFATVVSCDWLNVRRTPSSANSNNIIEAIRVNTRVEILERTDNGWTKIMYGNNKIGYVHSNFLSR